MTYTNFRTLVASFVQNSVSSFTVNSLPILDAVINQVRLRAQRDYDFHSLMTKGGLAVNAYGASLDDALELPVAGSDSQPLKTIRGLFEFSLNDAGDDFYFGAQYAFGEYSQMAADLGNRTSVAMYAVGRKIYAINQTDDLYVAVLGIPWLADIDFGTDGSTSDIFTTYGVDWTMWETLDTLNGYLKEEERIPVSMSKKRETWESFIGFDKEVELSYTNFTALD